MDIKDLNKPQLILLALLLSFVTSIATGITTVTLMQQAPESVTVPINRVVQQTVEKIQQVEGKTTIETVIIKEEDLMVDAIAKNRSAMFTVSKDDRAFGQGIPDLLARGFAVSNDGVIVTDGSFARHDLNYFVANANGIFRANLLYTDPAGFSFLKIGTPLDGTAKPGFSVPIPGDMNVMKAGQKIIVLGGTITSFLFEGDKNLRLNVSRSNVGGMLINLDGAALGIALSGEAESFVPINVINEALKTKLTL